MASGLKTRELIRRYGLAVRSGEKMALEAEIRRRNVKVHVYVRDTEDWLGADNVYVKLSAGGRHTRSYVKKLNDGERHTFTVSLDNALDTAVTMDFTTVDGTAAAASDI